MGGWGGERRRGPNSLPISCSECEHKIAPLQGKEPQKGSMLMISWPDRQIRSCAQVGAERKGNKGFIDLKNSNEKEGSRGQV